MTDLALMWFRQDLRIEHNPALLQACQHGKVLPVFVLDDEAPGEYRHGGASRWWLHHSLDALNRQLDGRLQFFKGNAENIIEQLADRHRVSLVCWNRCYEPWQIARDKRLKQTLLSKGIDAHSFNASLIWEPWQNCKDDGSAYRVFTPFYKAAIRNGLPDLPAHTGISPDNFEASAEPGACSLRALGLMPSIPWYLDMEKQWQPGAQGARKALDRFLESGMRDYKQARDFPATEGVSRLSPHLRFGEISPLAVAHAAAEASHGMQAENDAEHFIRELCWREFSYHLLFHFPDIPHRNFNGKFDAFPWQSNPSALAAWQRGNTGYPLVDAGMRELWQTGYMHNRVRMVVGSFLVKNLLIHWHHGERWFWDCLLDADLANNACSWQWVAGSGVDAAPYFRVFNPVTQSRKFDSQGDYIRRFVPELAGLSDKWIHEPWLAPEAELETAGIVLGSDYPLPIVDLKESRESALAAYAQLKEASASHS